LEPPQGLTRRWFSSEACTELPPFHNPWGDQRCRPLCLHLFLKKEKDKAEKGKRKMRQIKKYVKKRFVFTVDTPGIAYPKKFDLDKNVKFVHGMLLSSDKPNLLFYRGSQKIEINGEEIFPEDYEARLLMSGISVSPDQKYADLGDGVLAGNGEVKVTYKDTDNPAAFFESYEVRIYLMCELN
jgi:hypothetical protein